MGWLNAVTASHLAPAGRIKSIAKARTEGLSFMHTFCLSAHVMLGAIDDTSAALHRSCNSLHDLRSRPFRFLIMHKQVLTALLPEFCKSVTGGSGWGPPGWRSR